MNKKIYIYYLTMIICFCIDSVITYFLPFDFAKASIMIVPHVGLMMFLLLNNTIDNESRYIFAASMGLYFAIIYANSLAIYALLYCVYAFGGKMYTKLSSFTYLESLIAFILTIFVQEAVIYWLMWITNITEITVISFVLLRLLPTIGFNVALSVPLFFIHKKLGFEGKNNAY